MSTLAEDVSKLVWSSAGFQSFERGLNGQRNAPLHALHKRAFGRFEKIGFPTTRNEAWKYTNVAPIAERGFHPAPAEFDADEAAELIARGELSAGTAKIVFINGRFSSEHSTLPRTGGGLRLRSIAEVLEASAGDCDKLLLEAGLASVASYEQESFVALNTAFVSDGAMLVLEDGVQIAEPIAVLFVNTSAASGAIANSRLFASLGRGAQAAIFESFVGAPGTEYFSNAVFEAQLEPEARLEHVRLQLESDSAFHISSVCAAQAERSSFSTTCFSFGGRLVRNNASSVLNGENSLASFNGLSVLSDEQHVDNSTLLDHAKPNSESHELYRGIYSGKSHGVFCGTIIVRPDAQKTNAFQSNSGLLLSDTASFDTKPQLKIWADDVKCSHGATVGQIDEDGLFYLRSRGVPEAAARRMLVRAYAADVVSKVENDTARALLDRLIEEKLSASGN